MSNRGQGVDLEYRYALNSTTSNVLNRGKWLTSFIQDTQVNKSRALISGMHRQQVNPDLTVNAQAFILSDPKILNDLSNSGVQRALPSGDSNLYVSQRLDVGNVYLLGQYLQPLQAGGKDTFQRLPEIGANIINLAPFDGPILLGLESELTNFYRDVGFQQNRADIIPHRFPPACGISGMSSIKLPRCGFEKCITAITSRIPARRTVKRFGRHWKDHRS